MCLQRRALLVTDAKCSKSWFAAPHRGVHIEPPVGGPMIKHACSCTCVVLLLFLSFDRAEAHPHVWVTFHSEILYAADGSMTGVRHAWTFDDMFSAYALQGISHAKKSQYTRQ